MQYEIFGDSLPAVRITLNRGESIYTQSGGMTWMSSDLEMKTNMKGGMLKGIGRMLTGDSLFMATYTASSDNQEIVIASTLPGTILAYKIENGKELMMQKSAFLCAQPDVAVEASLNKKVGASLFGGEGFLMQKIKGSGLAFFEIDGTMVEKELKSGEKIKVDTGNVAGFESSVDYSIETVKGFANVLFGGEGLFLTTLKGPGKVWLQTMTVSNFAGKIIPFLPKSK